MICDFDKNPHPGVPIYLICKRCGHAVLTESKRVVRLCNSAKPDQQPRGPCKLLGEEIDRIDCKSCGGAVRIKVFDCPLHGRCVIGKKIDGVQNCSACGDWQ